MLSQRPWPVSRGRTGLRQLVDARTQANDVPLAHAEQSRRDGGDHPEGREPEQPRRQEEQPDGLKKWYRRGLPEECASEDIAQGCIRCDKSTDGTIGFFAVCFVRDTSINGIQTQEDDEEEWQGIP